MIGNMGVLLGVGVLIILALRGVSVLVASILCAAIVALTNGQDLATALFTNYTQAMFGFAGAFFLLFVTGSVFGRMMGETHAAASVAYALGERLGPQRTLLIGLIVCALLTYGGVSVFIVVFTVYPLGLGLMKQSNTPKRLFLAATSLGAGTFTMTAMPGSPAIHNVLMAQALGTPLTAAPVLGLLMSGLMLGLGFWYLEWARKRAEAAGEGFVAAITDVIPKDPDPRTMPHWGLAVLPMAVVLAVILFPQLILSKFFPPAEGAGGLYAKIMTLAMGQPIVWTSVALVIGTALGFVMFRRYVMGIMGVLGRGAEGAIMPLINTSVVIGFGGVVTKTPVFDNFAKLMLDTGINPLLSAVLSVNIISGIVGSASGGLRIFTDSLAQHYVEAGVPVELLHRFVAVGAGGLDSLPHCGAIITMLTIMGLSHKEAYKDAAVVTILVPLVALAVVLTGVLVFG